MATGAGGLRPRLLLGVVAAAVAVSIWAGWVLLVRVAPGQGLAPLDLALLRFGAPALALAPVWRRRGVLPAGVSPLRIAAMTLGWGTPFVLLVGEGARTAPAPLIAALVPGTMPLWAALIGALALGVRPAPRARLGLALIALGAAAAVGPLLAGAAAGLPGAPWLLAGSVAWAAYALAYRGSGLSPVEATAIVAFWSTVIALPLAAVSGSGLWRLAPAELAWQLALHGALAGVVSVIAFAVAIRELGAARAAAASALVPGLAAAGGAFWLGEPVGWPLALALAASMAGVALVNAAPAPRAG